MRGGLRGEISQRETKMNSGLTDRETVRQYLLGRLDGSEAIESGVSDEIFLNKNNLSDVVESVEDEIIEQYSEGLLDAADRKAVEEYFLVSAERRAELRFFKILQNHFGTTTNAMATDASEVYAREYDARSARLADAPRFRRFRFLIYGQAAAIIALCVFGLAYRSGLQRKQSLLEADLARERVRSSSLTAELERQRAPTMVLTLVPGLSRKLGVKLQEVEIKSSSQRIMVEIPVGGHTADPYEIELEDQGGGRALWSAKLLPVIAPSGDARLVFDLSAQDLKSGVHSIVISQQGLGGVWREYCDFEVKTTK